MRNDRWARNGREKIVLALAINLAFLALMLCCFQPRFETNDDVFMSKFVDGQMAHKTAFVPFINIVLGWFLKLLYTVGGDNIPWWSVCEYTVLLLGFTAITWTLLRRFRPLAALTMTAAILCTLAADAYLSMNFSKTAAGGTVGGLCLMLYGMRNETGRVIKPALILGFLLSVTGFLWRFEEFFACAAVIAGVGLTSLLEIAAEARGERASEIGKKMLRYAAPFLLLVAIVIALFGGNLLAWNSEKYKDYYIFDWTRSILIDFEVPEYEQMPEVYDELEMDSTAIKLLEKWNFYDTEKFTTESMQRIIDARSEFVTYPTLGEMLGIFLRECIPGFYRERPLAGFLLMLALFLACGRRRARDWAGVLWMPAAFFCLYLFFIYNERYLVNRVDIGLFLAMAAGLSWYLAPEKLKEEKLLCTVLLLLTVFIGYRACRKACPFDSHNTLEDTSAQKAAVERILEDGEHLYFVKFLSINHELYGPLETAPRGYADKILQLGGWSCRHPEIERVLSEWGIENPYADMIGNERIYLIDEDIETTLAYMNKYHDPTATAERVEPLSTETNLKIYRILSGAEPETRP